MGRPFTYMNGNMEDITERKQAEASVGDSLKLLNNLLQAASTFSIVASDPDGLITVFNQGSELMLGYSAEEMIGLRNVLGLHSDPEIAARETELTSELGYPVKGFNVFAAKPKLEGSETREWTYVRKDGSTFPVSLVVTAIRDDKGKIIGYLEIANDITKRILAGKECNTLAAIVRHSSELVNLADTDGKLIFLNEAGANMLGISPDDIKKINIIQIINYPLKDFVKNELLPKLLAGGTWEGDLQLINLRTGAIMDVHTIAFTIDDPHTPGKKYLANISLDITQRKQTEEKFGKVFMMAPDMITITRMADGLIIDVNIGFEEITGWKRSDVIGQTSYDLNFWIDPEDRTLMVEELKAGRDVVQREISFRHKDGSLRSGIYSARFISIAGEHCLVFVMQDITKRKETEKILKENEKRLRSITGNMPGVVFQFYVKDSGEMEVSYAGERMPEILGLPTDKTILFTEFRSHIYEKDLEKFGASIKKAVERYAHWDFEGRFVKPSGEVIWINGLSTPTRHEDRMVFDGIILDISKRKQAEEMSHLSEEKFSKVFLTTPNGIAITRLNDGQFMDINPGFEQSSGWKLQEVKGRSSLDINFWVNPAERALMVEELKTGKDILYHEFQFRHRDGTERTGIYSAKAISIADEPCLVFVMQDITDQRRMEEDRRKLELHLFQSQKMDAIGQLAGGLAHDFNNILMSIQGNASLMMMDYDAGHPHCERLRRIEEHVQRGADLTKQLLGFASGGKYEVKTLSINDLIRKSSEFFIETKKEIKIDLQLQDDLYPVEADAGQIEQALLNIYINAGHAMPGGGNLRIQTTGITVSETDARAFEIKPGDYVRISISDTGTGMDKDTLKRIFEPFFTTRAQLGGTGLGLASTYGIIRNHGGIINAYSEPGQGSTFNIYLPSSGEKTEIKEDLKPDKSLFSGSGGILVVDDEPAILELAAKLLEKLGYTVYQAETEQEAVSVYREKQDVIDLVILDMILRGASGSQVMKTLREINPDVKVILSSGYSIQGETQKVMDMGCLGFIQKPYTFAELSGIVHRALTAPPGS